MQPRGSAATPERLWGPRAPQNQGLRSESSAESRGNRTEGELQARGRSEALNRPSSCHGACTFSSRPCAGAPGMAPGTVRPPATGPAVLPTVLRTGPHRGVCTPLWRPTPAPSLAPGRTRKALLPSWASRSHQASATELSGTGTGWGLTAGAPPSPLPMGPQAFLVNLLPAAMRGREGQGQRRVTSQPMAPVETLGPAYGRPQLPGQRGRMGECGPGSLGETRPCPRCTGGPSREPLRTDSSSMKWAGRWSQRGPRLAAWV